MPVSHERMLEILQISNGERVHYLDTKGFGPDDWARLDAAMEEETIAFCRTNSDPEELHAFAQTWNWDQGTWALEELLDNPACQAATALMIYWKAGPEYFRKYRDRDALVADPLGAIAIADFDFVAKLEARYVAGDFPAGTTAFDPADPRDPFVGTYDRDRDKFVRALPPVMYLAVAPAGP